MINLLPLDQKNSIKYAKYNRKLIGYVVATVLIAILLILMVGGLNLYTMRQLKDVEQNIAARRATAQINAPELAKIKKYEAGIKKINEIYAASPDFAQLMADIGKTLRPGVRIGGLTLNGDEQQPLSISLISESETAALESRITLEKSERFSTVDILSTQRGEDGLYRVEMIASFEQGKAQ